jgi:uncharacterized protein
MLTIERARAWYEPQDPVHGIDHVERVLRTALWLCQRTGADVEIVQAAALLHDAKGAVPDGDREQGRASHEESSAAFAREVLAEEGWPEERIAQVEHCIRSHRYRGGLVPESLEAQVLFDADKLDVLGAFGIARTLAYAQQAGQPAFAAPSARFLDDGEKEKGEPHSAYHEYLFKLRKVPQVLNTAPARQLAAQRAPLLHHFFQELAAESDFAAS